MKKITCAADLESLSYPYQLQDADLRGAILEGADLQGANLQGANLQGANLQGANLRGADLTGAILWGADLRGAILAGADLRGAILHGADLVGAILQGANLQGANLQGAILRDANLRGANLQGANLRYAILRYAILEDADLQGADLQGAILWGADLTGAKFPELLVKLPPLGESFIAWKKVCEGFILKLEIPADSPRVSTFIGRKCRARSAKVLEAFTISGEPTEETEFRSLHNYWFIYRVGETVEVPDFDDDIRVECTKGIHFFETRGEAKRY